MDFPFLTGRIVLGLALASVLSAHSQEQPVVTVEAQRLHLKLEHDVQAFTHQAIIRPPAVYNQSLERWNDKVCPQVQGLNRAEGEFILARLSKIANAAGVPLGGEKCGANFVVFVTAQPETAIKQMLKVPRLFDGKEDKAAVKEFLSNPRPVRVWRNIYLTSIDGSQHLRVAGEKVYNLEIPTTQLPSIYGSRINVAQVTRDINSAIVVVDANQVRDLNVAQLGDYIGMIGFAQMDLDRDIAEVPTILNLFRLPAEKRPLEMTKWDKALLKGLYSAPQRDAMQVSEIESIAVKQIEAANSP